MRKVLVVITLAVFSTILSVPSHLNAMHATDESELVASSNANFAISVRGTLGYLSGQARELVYDTDIAGDYTASELIWDIKNLIMVGGVVSANIFNKFSVNAGIWTSLINGSGGMDDYDWNTDIARPNMDDWTDHSYSDVDSKATMFDINAVTRVIAWNGINFNAMMGYRSDSWTWNDSAQDFVYSEVSFRDYAGSFGGLHVIDYKQNFSLPYIGVSAEGPIGPVNISVYALYSPVRADDEDFHVLRGLLFKETFSNGTFFGLGLKGTYYVNPSTFISAAVDYQSIPEFTGDTEVADMMTGLMIKYKDSAGIENTVTMFSVSAGYKF
jgi:outer membrane protease